MNDISLLDEMRGRLRDPATRERTLTDLGNWVKETCLMAGTGAATAQVVAALFVAGLDQKPAKPNNFWTIRDRESG